MRWDLLFALAAIPLLTAGSAQAREPRLLALEPASNWTVNYDSEQCTLLRDFGPENNRLHLQIESYGSTSDFRILMAGKPVPRSNFASGKVRLAFPNDTVRRDEVSTLEGTTGSNTAAVTFNASFAPYEPRPTFTGPATAEQLALGAQPHPPSPEFERAIDRVTVGVNNRVRLELHLGRMERPLQALRTCVEDLQKSWGLDPAVQNNLSRFPMPDLSSVRRVQNNYPASMVMEGRSAFVPVRIMVNAEGEATDCVVQVPSIEREFSSVVCNNLARRFSPALDEGGNAVAAMYRTSVIYQIAR